MRTFLINIPDANWNNKLQYITGKIIIQFNNTITKYLYIRGMVKNFFLLSFFFFLNYNTLTLLFSFLLYMQMLKKQ